MTSQKVDFLHSNDLSDHLEQYKRFSPKFLRQRLKEKIVGGYGIESGSHEVFVSLLFADISGFTQLSSRLSAEELKTHINGYFTKLLSVVQEHHGDVVKFCGDAVLIMWPLSADAAGEMKAAAVMMSCLCALQLMEDCGEYRRRRDGSRIVPAIIGDAAAAADAGSSTSVCGSTRKHLNDGVDDSLVELSLHCGISCGSARWFVLEGQQQQLSEFVITGDVLHEMGLAETHAHAGEICIHPKAYEAVKAKLDAAPVFSHAVAAEQIERTTPEPVAYRLSGALNAQYVKNRRLSRKNAAHVQLPAANASVTGADAVCEVKAIVGSIGAMSIDQSEHAEHRCADNSTRIRRLHRHLGSMKASFLRARQSSSSSVLSSSVKQKQPSTAAAEAAAAAAAMAPRLLGTSTMNQAENAHCCEDRNTMMHKQKQELGVFIRPFPDFDDSRIADSGVQQRQTTAAAVENVKQSYKDARHTKATTIAASFGLFKANTSRGSQAAMTAGKLGSSAAKRSGVSGNASGVIHESSSVSISLFKSRVDPSINNAHPNRHFGSSTAVSLSQWLPAAMSRGFFRSNSKSVSSHSNSEQLPLIQDCGFGAMPASASRSQDLSVSEEMQLLTAGGRPRMETTRTSPVAKKMSVRALKVKLRYFVDEHIQAVIRQLSSWDSTRPQGVSGLHCDSAAINELMGFSPARSARIERAEALAAGERTIIINAAASQESLSIIDAENVKDEVDVAAVTPKKTVSFPAVGDAAMMQSKRSLLAQELRRYVHSIAARAIESSTVQFLSEMREVATIFIQLLDLDASFASGDRTVPQQVFSIISNETSKLGGSMRQFVVDDKGCVVIVCFGLLGSSNQNNSVQAVQFALSTRELLRTVKCRSVFGITLGTVYCGLVGAGSRCEYAVMGSSVNLSARLMAACVKSFTPPAATPAPTPAEAPPHACAGSAAANTMPHSVVVFNPQSILVDAAVHKKAISVFQFVRTASIRAKGYADPVAVFAPIRRVKACRSVLVRDTLNRQQSSFLKLERGTYEQPHCQQSHSERKVKASEASQTTDAVQRATDERTAAQRQNVGADCSPCHMENGAEMSNNNSTAGNFRNYTRAGEFSYPAQVHQRCRTGSSVECTYPLQERDAQLREVMQLLIGEGADVPPEVSQSVVISGEEGIGKSSFLAKLLECISEQQQQQLGEQQALVVHHRCTAMHRYVPYHTVSRLLFGIFDIDPVDGPRSGMGAAAGAGGTSSIRSKRRGSRSAARTSQQHREAVVFTTLQSSHIRDLLQGQPLPMQSAAANCRDVPHHTLNRVVEEDMSTRTQSDDDCSSSEFIIRQMSERVDQFDEEKHIDCVEIQNYSPFVCATPLSETYNQLTDDKVNQRQQLHLHTSPRVDSLSIVTDSESTATGTLTCRSTSTSPIALGSHVLHRRRSRVRSNSSMSSSAEQQGRSPRYHRKVLPLLQRRGSAVLQLDKQLSQYHHQQHHHHQQQQKQRNRHSCLSRKQDDCQNVDDATSSSACLSNFNAEERVFPFRTADASAAGFPLPSTETTVLSSASSASDHADARVERWLQRRIPSKLTMQQAYECCTASESKPWVSSQWLYQHVQSPADRHVVASIIGNAPLLRFAPLLNCILNTSLSFESTLSSDEQCGCEDVSNAYSLQAAIEELDAEGQRLLLETLLITIILCAVKAPFECLTSMKAAEASRDDSNAANENTKRAIILVDDLQHADANSMILWCRASSLLSRLNYPAVSAAAQSHAAEEVNSTIAMNTLPNGNSDTNAGVSALGEHQQDENNSRSRFSAVLESVESGAWSLTSIHTAENSAASPSHACDAAARNSRRYGHLIGTMTECTATTSQQRIQMLYDTVNHLDGGPYGGALSREDLHQLTVRVCSSRIVLQRLSLEAVCSVHTDVLGLQRWLWLMSNASLAIYGPQCDGNNNGSSNNSAQSMHHNLKIDETDNIKVDTAAFHQHSSNIIEKGKPMFPIPASGEECGNRAGSDTKTSRRRGIRVNYNSLALLTGRHDPNTPRAANGVRTPVHAAVAATAAATAVTVRRRWSDAFASVRHHHDHNHSHNHSHCTNGNHSSQQLLQRECLKQLYLLTKSGLPSATVEVARAIRDATEMNCFRGLYQLPLVKQRQKMVLEVIDSLDALEVAVLKAASVIDQAFQFEELANTLYGLELFRDGASSRDALTIQRLLNSLCATGLLHQLDASISTPSSASEDATDAVQLWKLYQFSEETTRLTVYNLMLDSQRQRAHTMVALSLETALHAAEGVRRLQLLQQVTHHYQLSDNIPRRLGLLRQSLACACSTADAAAALWYCSALLQVVLSQREDALISHCREAEMQLVLMLTQRMKRPQHEQREVMNNSCSEPSGKKSRKSDYSFGSSGLRARARTLSFFLFQSSKKSRLFNNRVASVDFEMPREQVPFKASAPVEIGHLLFASDKHNSRLQMQLQRCSLIELVLMRRHLLHQLGRTSEAAAAAAAAVYGDEITRDISSVMHVDAWYGEAARQRGALCGVTELDVVAWVRIMADIHQRRNQLQQSAVLAALCDHLLLSMRLSTYKCTHVPEWGSSEKLREAAKASRSLQNLSTLLEHCSFTKRMQNALSCAGDATASADTANTRVIHRCRSSIYTTHDLHHISSFSIAREFGSCGEGTGTQPTAAGVRILSRAGRWQSQQQKGPCLSSTKLSLECSSGSIILGSSYAFTKQSSDDMMRFFAEKPRQFDRCCVQLDALLIKLFADQLLATQCLEAGHVLMAIEILCNSFAAVRNCICATQGQSLASSTRQQVQSLLSRLVQLYSLHSLAYRACDDAQRSVECMLCISNSTCCDLINTIMWYLDDSAAASAFSDARGMAYVFYSKAQHAASSGRLHQSLQHLQQAYALCELCGNDQLLQRVALLSAWLWLMLGEFDGAMSMLGICSAAHRRSAMTEGEAVDATETAENATATKVSELQVQSLLRPQQQQQHQHQHQDQVVQDCPVVLRIQEVLELCLVLRFCFSHSSMSDAVQPYDPNAVHSKWHSLTQLSGVRLVEDHLTQHHSSAADAAHREHGAAGAAGDGASPLASESEHRRNSASAWALLSIRAAKETTVTASAAARITTFGTDGGPPAAAALRGTASPPERSRDNRTPDQTLLQKHFDVLQCNLNGIDCCNGSCAEFNGGDAMDEMMPPRSIAFLPEGIHFSIAVSSACETLMRYCFTVNHQEQAQQQSSGLSIVYEMLTSIEASISALKRVVESNLVALQPLYLTLCVRHDMVVVLVENMKSFSNRSHFPFITAQLTAEEGIGAALHCPAHADARDRFAGLRRWLQQALLQRKTAASVDAYAPAYADGCDDLPLRGLQSSTTDDLRDDSDDDDVIEIIDQNEAIDSNGNDCAQDAYEDSDTNTATMEGFNCRRDDEAETRSLVSLLSRRSSAAHATIFCDSMRMKEKGDDGRMLKEGEYENRSSDRSKQLLEQRHHAKLKKKPTPSAGAGHSFQRATPAGPVRNCRTNTKIFPVAKFFIRELLSELRELQADPQFAHT